VSRFWCFEAVDIEIIQPSEEYIEESLAVEGVGSWIERQRARSVLGGWSVFMVTGLAISRGVKGNGGGWAEDWGRGADGEPEV
jgi:hypothetical protein